VPAPPETIARHAPIRFPGGAVLTRDERHDGLVTCCSMSAAASSSSVPPISPISTTRVRALVRLEERERIDEARADNGIAPDPMHVDWPIPARVSCHTTS
jgi:hypothetical protein